MLKLKWGKSEIFEKNLRNVWPLKLKNFKCVVKYSKFSAEIQDFSISYLKTTFK